MKHYTDGFTLIELLIAIAIIGVLTAVAVPSYQQYTRKARYTEIVQAIAPFKLGIEECFQITDNLKKCQPGQNGVPPNIENGNGLVHKIIIGEDGTITVTPRKLHGINPNDNYVLIPSKQKNQLLWQSGGGGVTAGYAN